MKYELNFDAMVFAGEVFQCLLAGPGDDFFNEEEKNILNKLQISLFNESQFGDDSGDGKFDYLTYIGANIKKMGCITLEWLNHGIFFLVL